MMMLFWVVVLVALVALTWSLVQRGGVRASHTGENRPPGEDRAEEILRERFARGEIDEASYQRMRDELQR